MLKTVNMRGIEAQLWEEFAYEVDKDGGMLVRYFERLIAEITKEACG